GRGHFAVADPAPADMNALMSHTPDRPSGRMALGLGVGCALLGLLLYGVQLSAGRTDAPWYAPALATLGVVLVLASLQRRRGAWRALALVLVAFLAVFEWWFLLVYARLPAYAGPVRVGQPFPEFRVQTADGTPFTRADLSGGRATALVFFRGRW